MLVLLWSLYVCWVCFFIWGIFERPKEFKYYPYNYIKTSRGFENHIQCIIFYTAGLLMLLCVFPIFISNYLANLTKFKDDL